MPSRLTHMLAAATALGLGYASTGIAAGGAYPVKPVRVIVPYLPGGITDSVARLVARQMSAELGQPFIVENRAGADSLIGTRAVKEAPADGYTILATSNAFSILPALKKAPGYTPLTDFRGIGPMMTAPFVLDVGSGQPYCSVQDLIAKAKDNAAPISYASPGTGTPNHIATEIFFRKTGIQGLTHVPFKGASAAVIEVASERIPFYMDAYATSAPHIRSGKIRPLAVTSARRIAALPDVPTLVEQNIDFTYEYWLGMLVRAGTPDSVVERLSSALRQALTTPALRERMASEGATVRFIPPAEFDGIIRKEVEDIARLQSDLRIEKQ
ncbi:putative Bug-like extracytoplasmic solute binding receptor, TTT family [Cupriavidus necator]|uniref:Putative Bug-like extracytoplasmic solute binding receptor, TTT family n=1 Tax=Cupriavidus necator TaxID=106590 RepID=A0A1K0II06_CUPNE|nr:putative Bug-like extracytoplasmic solute binding receptor, TTT family [Cupriavidus necator]